MLSALLPPGWSNTKQTDQVSQEKGNREDWELASELPDQSSDLHNPVYQ